MTIAAAYLTTEGVVLGADSTSTVTDPEGNPIQLLNHAQKVFEIGADSRSAMCMYGAGDVCGTSHRTIAAILGDKIAATPDMNTEGIANELAQLVGKTIADSGRPFGGVLGYFLGGCDPVAHVPKLFSVEFKVKAPGQLEANVTERSLGPIFGGAFNYFSRVFHGIDPNLQRELAIELVKELPDVDSAKVRKAFEGSISSTLPKYGASGWTDLPIREAIDFVHTYLHITIKVEKFRAQTQACGGPIEIAFVTSDRKLRWSRHKQFDSAIVEHHNHPR